MNPLLQFSDPDYLSFNWHFPNDEVLEEKAESRA
jgi:hypothetical protein